MSLGKEIGVRDYMEGEDRSLILANDKRQAVKRSTSGGEQIEFMKIFYQHLLKGESASEALNQATNYMRESEEFGAVKY